jgi:hypothetical protein
MKRFIFLALLGSAIVAAPTLVGDDAAHAQPAAALGKPLPDGGLPAGTISVRIVAGAPSTPVVGTDVTLVVNGTPRVARTDSSGRAMFPSVPAGAQVQAKVLDADGKEIASEAFGVPTSGGVRLMLSTKPFEGGGGAAPPMPGGGGHGPMAGGMPEARAMSGQPRPDRGVVPGSYQIRVTYNNLQIKDGEASDSEPPVGETVTLVGYSFDESVSVNQVKVNAEGYAQFDGLDVAGNVIYFALTRLPRNGAVDRLAAVPVQMETQAGAKLILSSEKRTSTTPPIDDLAGAGTPTTPPAGKIVVNLDGYVRELPEVTLVDAVSKQVVAKAKASVAPPDPSKIESGVQFKPDAGLPPGNLEVYVHGGAGMQDQPMKDIALRVVPADATNVAEGVAATTGGDGKVRLAVADKTKKHRLLYTVNGKELASAEVDLSASGGRLDVIARWEGEGKPQVVFDVPYNPAHVLYAETRTISVLTGKQELYRSMPFLPIETAGAYTSIAVLPRVLFQFHLQGFVEDEILGVRGLWRIANNSWIPYRATADGMLVQLPKGHVGGVVGERFQGEVSVAQGEGFRIVRALPPGWTEFEAGFSMKSDDGQVKWHFDLPYGAFQSILQIRWFPELDVQLPEGVTGDRYIGQSGAEWFRIDDIMIPTNRSMVMTIGGLPSHAAWKKWVPRIVGIAVVLLMLGGIVLALTRKPAAAAEASGTAKRREELMNELVELERTGDDPARREQILTELERIWE